MRRLTVLRHAKSSWDAADLTDHERPLNKRGRKAAPLIGRYLRERDLVPGYVLCSSSTRTRETLDLLDLGDVAVEFSDALYGADAGEIAGLVRNLDSSIDAAMLIGHNPGMQDYAARIGLDVEKFPTAACATFEVAADWNDLAPDAVRLVDFTAPKQLAN